MLILMVRLFCSFLLQDTKNGLFRRMIPLWDKSFESDIMVQQGIVACCFCNDFGKVLEGTIRSLLLQM